ncbi:MAG: hypothetical protein AAGF88_12725 [Pseudomonadota bacterium]
MRSAVFILSLAMMGPARAEPPVTLDLAGLVALVSEPWRNGPTFEADLAEMLPGLVISTDTLPGGPRDPFAWVRDGHFASVPGVVPIGANVICSRYGLATRDHFAERELTDPETFRLFSLYQVEHDEATAWPEGAVARMSCHITWDDSRALTILPEDVVAEILAQSFAEISDTKPPGQAAFYGAEGYRLTATGGISDTVRVLDRSVVVLTLRHQSVRVRSFLMNGGL